MEQTPKSEPTRRRIWLWIVGSSVALLALTALVLATLIGTSWQLGREVAELGGRIEWTKWHTGIEHVFLPNGGVDDKWLKAHQWGKFSTIRSLELKRCDISSEGLRALQELPSLERLDLEGNRARDPQDLLELKAFTRLRHLLVDSSMLDRRGAIDNFAQLTQLTDLSFYGRQIDPEKLDELKARLPRVRIVVLDPTATSMSFRTVMLDAIPRLLFLPDGRRIVTGDGRGHIQVRDAKTQVVLWDIAAHADWVFGLATNQDGSLLASAGGDNAIHLWDLERRQQLATLTGHDDDVHTLAFASGRRLLSSSDDMTVREWDLDSLDREATSPQVITTSQVVISDHADTIPALAVSRDGTMAASGSRDGTLRLWQRKPGGSSKSLVHSVHARPSDEAARFNPAIPRGDVMSLAFDANGQHLASIGYDGAVRIWDVVTGSRVAEWPVTRGWAFTVEYSPNGRLIATGGRAGQVTLWTPAGTRLQEFKADDDVSSLAFSPDGQQLAAATAAGSVHVWKVEATDKTQREHR